MPTTLTPTAHQILREELYVVLREELASVTSEMLDAGSAAALAVSVERLPGGKTRARQTSEAAYLTAIYRAMLLEKLAGVGS